MIEKHLQVLLEFAWVGLSTLKTDLNQEMWDQHYRAAHLKTIEDLSIVQIKSESKLSDERTRKLFLGLIKQFMLQVNKH